MSDHTLANSADYVLALGAYEKQVILELDKLQASWGASIYKDKYGARILFHIITDSWERKRTVEDCVLALNITSLLLFRGIVPSNDAIAILIQQNKTQNNWLSERH